MEKTYRTDYLAGLFGMSEQALEDWATLYGRDAIASICVNSGKYYLKGGMAAAEFAPRLIGYLSGAR